MRTVFLEGSGQRILVHRSHSFASACHVVDHPNPVDVTGGSAMTTTELESKVDGGCSPDGACAVVDHRASARIGQPAMVLPGAMEALQAVGAAIAATGLPERI